ncbi:MAG: hypothetical protein K6G63_02195 [Eubacterium sp.]|nr:hypothetical protein [Eubacterium sp.]
MADKVISEEKLDVDDLYIKNEAKDKSDWNEVDHLNDRDRISKLASSQEEADRSRKQSMQYKIDRADGIFQLFLLVFGLGFWIVMIIRLFL